MRPTRLSFAALAISSALFVGACGSDSSSSDSTVAAPVETVAPDTAVAADTVPAESVPAESTPAESTPDTSMMAAGASFGPGCAAVPADGAGSFAGMAQDPAATAASNNPALSTLVAAVTAANLGDTLNGPGPFTIFAPANDAFGKIDSAALDALLADPTGDLTKILTYHVVPGKALSAAELLTSGSEATVQGGTVTITGSGQDVTVNDAKVVCGDVKVANGIVHIIDTVLMPS